MSKRKPDPATYEMTDDEPEMAELEEHAREIREILDKHGVTRERMIANIPEAKRRSFARFYPELAAEYDDRAA